MIPDKIYIHGDNDIMGEVLSQRADGDIEYVRKDAFIEKVLKFLDKYFIFNNRYYSIESGVFDSKEEMFACLKKYMDYETDR